MALHKYFKPSFWFRAAIFILRRIWAGAIAVAVYIVTSVVRALPARARLQIRQNAALVRKMDYPNASISIAVDSWIEDEYRANEAKKEPGTVDWIEGWLKAGDVFYDIGANVGSYSLITFGFLKGEAKIYAFEPGFLSFAQLCKNIHLNNASSAISPLQIALSDTTSLLNFHYQNLETGGALHSLGDPMDHKGKSFEPVFSLPTLSYSLDDFVLKFDLPKPNHIKMDVDGLEYRILQGAEKMLSHPDLQSILLETNAEPEDSKHFDDLLAGHGLVLHSRRDFNSLYIRKS